MNTLSDNDIRQLAKEAVKQLGQTATPEAIQEVVKQAISRINTEQSTVDKPVDVQMTSPPRKAGNRIIVTAFGKNRTGILAGITTILAKHDCDIVDLSQKILQDFFTIMLLVDISTSKTDFENIKNDIIKTGEDLDLKVIVQHEEIFNTMHRV
jgi:ACT domain-containing protein